MQNLYTPSVAVDHRSQPGNKGHKGGSGVFTNSRFGGRLDNQLRRIFMDVGVLSQSSGSAYVEFDSTKVICSVYGPHVVEGSEASFSEEGQLACDFRYAPFSAAGGERREPDRRMAEDEVEMSQLLSRALAGSVQLAKLPKSRLDVRVAVLRDDGGALAAATVAASLALATAGGVELADLVAACTVGCPPAPGAAPLLDPTAAELAGEEAPAAGRRGGAGAAAAAGGEGPAAAEEERRRRRPRRLGAMTVAVLPATREVTQWLQEGQIDQAAIGKAVELCMDGCAHIHGMMRRTLMDYARRQIKKK